MGQGGLRIVDGKSMVSGLGISSVEPDEIADKIGSNHHDPGQFFPAQRSIS